MYDYIANFLYIIGMVLICSTLPVVLFCKYYAFAQMVLPTRLYSTISALSDESIKSILMVYLIALAILFLVAYSWVAVVVIGCFIWYIIKGMTNDKSF